MIDRVVKESVDSKDLQDRLIEHITSDNLPVLYSNNVAMQSSLWDFRMDFGQIMQADIEAFVFKDLLTVIMSPQHAKVFSEVLAKHVEAYEKKYGAIPTAPEAEKEAASKLSSRVKRVSGSRESSQRGKATKQSDPKSS